MKAIRLLLACLLVLCLALPALSENAEQGPLNVEELRAFTNGLLERAIKEGASVVQSEEGFMAEGLGFTLFLTSEDLSADTVVSAAEVHMGSIHVDGMQGPRGLAVSSQLGELLAAYQNDNALLRGDMNGAVLYIDGELPDLGVGKLTRDGQRVNMVEYSVYQPADDGINRQGLQYLIENNEIIGIRYFGGGDVLTEQQAEQDATAASLLQEQTGYFDYALGEAGELTREDLSIQGLDFLDLTPAQATVVFGEATHEEEVKDSTGESIRILQWEGLEIAFIYDAKGALLRTDRVSVTAPGIEGPRGLRVGTTLREALSRFPGRDVPAADTRSLYGDQAGQQPPFGRLDTQGNESRLYLAVGLEEGSVLVSALFVDEQLVDLSITR